MIVETRQIAVAMIVLSLLFLEVVVAISCRNCSCNRPASTFIISCGCNFHFVGESKLIQTNTFPRIPPKIHQSYTFPYENPPFLGSQKFDFFGLIITILGLIITILTAKPQVKQHS